MTIPLVSGGAGSGQPAGGIISGSGGSPAQSIGSRLLAAIEQSAAPNGATSDPMLSYVVGLGSQSGTIGQSAAATTYNAQGLLSQLQGGMFPNDSLLSSAGTTLGTGQPDLQNALSITGQLNVSSVSTGLSTPSVSANGFDTTGSSGLTSLIRSNPSLAFTLEDGQIEQQFLGMLG